MDDHSHSMASPDGMAVRAGLLAAVKAGLLRSKRYRHDQVYRFIAGTGSRKKSAVFGRDLGFSRFERPLPTATLVSAIEHRLCTLLATCC